MKVNHPYYDISHYDEMFKNHAKEEKPGAKLTYARFLINLTLIKECTNPPHKHFKPGIIITPDTPMFIYELLTEVIELSSSVNTSNSHYCHIASEAAAELIAYIDDNDELMPELETRFKEKAAQLGHLESIYRVALDNFEKHPRKALAYFNMLTTNAHFRPAIEIAEKKTQHCSENK